MKKVWRNLSDREVKIFSSRNLREMIVAQASLDTTIIQPGSGQSARIGLPHIFCHDYYVIQSIAYIECMVFTSIYTISSSSSPNCDT